MLQDKSMTDFILINYRHGSEVGVEIFKMVECVNFLKTLSGNESEIFLSYFIFNR